MDPERKLVAQGHSEKGAGDGYVSEVQRHDYCSAEDYRRSI